MRLASLLVVLLARWSVAQPSVQVAMVSGTVRDSIARAPLASARVQLVAADDPSRFGRVVVTDSLGRFRIDSVPDGRYTIGFFHSLLDSLAIEPPLRQVVVRDGLPVVAHLATPSPARLRAAFCDAQQMDSTGVVVGVLRDARDRSAAPGVNVLAEWLNVSLVGGSVSRDVSRMETTTRETGWFVLCNVPRTGTLALSASRGADSVDRVDVTIPRGGFVRRDLYLGTGRGVVSTGSDSAARVRTGDGALRGTVVALVDQTPIGGALVRMVDGPQTRSNDRGEWTLDNLPLGTRTLEVRAISFLPERRAVDVVGDAAPVTVVMSSVRAVLDTVRVAAMRRDARDMQEFEDRRQMGLGKFITVDEIAKQKPFYTTDLFKTIPGMRVQRAALGNGFIEVRAGVLTSQTWCSPSVYLDERYVGILDIDDINTMISPADITGIEIYAGLSAPARFQRGVGDCGAIVIWSNLRSLPPRKFPFKTVGRALGLIGLSLLVGGLLTNRLM
jgi:hypothetical protein